MHKFLVHVATFSITSGPNLQIEKYCKKLTASNDMVLDKFF